MTMDSNFVTGMVVGGAGAKRATRAWKNTAVDWAATARENLDAANKSAATTLAIFDVLTTLPLETRMQIYTSLRDQLQPALATRFAKKGVSPQAAALAAQDFIMKIEESWANTVAQVNSQKALKAR